MIIVYLLSILGMFAIGAMLMWQGVDGWGWYWTVAVLIWGNLSVSRETKEAAK